MNEKQQNEILNMGLKLGFSLIPGGQLLSDLLDFQGKMKQERLNTFLTSFCNYLSTHKEISMESLQNEDFADLFESILRRVVRTKSTEKHARFKQILINQIERPTTDVDNTEMFLDLVTSLSEIEVTILKRHYENDDEITSLYTRENELSEEVKDKQRKVDKESGLKNSGFAHNYVKALQDFSLTRNSLEVVKLRREEVEVYRLASFYNLSDSQLVYYYQSLSSKGLLIDNAVGATFLGPFKSMKISEFGKQFWEFLKQ
ncbi:MAG: hypothetical protein WC756_00445 [Taibaiella sp.]|jgi:hypothetical protein